MEIMLGVNGFILDGKKEFYIMYMFDFLGLNVFKGLWFMSKFGEDVIVVVLDIGIWFESFSFLDYSVGIVF